MPSSSEDLSAVVAQIESLDWTAPMAAHGDVLSLFDSVAPQGIAKDLSLQLMHLVDVKGSTEKTTHYKWLLARDPDERFDVWLHEYKPATHRREGHASVAHNHRFWLTSLILKGGFTDTRFERANASGGISPIDSRAMRGGDTMVIAPEEIHALSELRDGTFSLIVQSSPVRSYSEVFENGEVRRYYDLEAKLPDTQASISSGD